jgi:hypothetical protein
MAPSYGAAHPLGIAGVAVAVAVAEGAGTSAQSWDVTAWSGLAAVFDEVAGATDGEVEAVGHA